MRISFIGAGRVGTTLIGSARAGLDVEMVASRNLHYPAVVHPVDRSRSTP